MVFVIDTDKNPLHPCREARARILLKQGKAAVWRMEPFTIILKRSVAEPIQADGYNYYIERRKPIPPHLIEDAVSSTIC